MTTRVWGNIRVHLNAIKKWRANNVSHTAAFRAVLKQLEAFIYEECSVYKHAWTLAWDTEATQLKCKVMFLIESIQRAAGYKMDD